MSNKYALRIRKSDLALLTLLNGGVVPVGTTKTSYLVFEVDEDGSAITSKVVTERELGLEYELGANSPFVLRLKK